MTKSATYTNSDSELAAIKRTVDQYMLSQADLRKALRKAGIITKSGKLTKQYRSK